MSYKISFLNINVVLPDCPEKLDVFRLSNLSKVESLLILYIEKKPDISFYNLCCITGCAFIKRIDICTIDQNKNLCLKLAIEYGI